MAGNIVFAIILAGTLAPLPAQGAAQGSSELQQAKAGWETARQFRDRIQGVWNVSVVRTDCGSGNVVAPLFDAMAVFGADGIFHDTNANNPTLMVRSDAFGHWKHVRGNKYRFAFRVFNFDVAGMYLGYQVVRHDVVLAKNGKTYTSSGTAEFFNPDGTQRQPVLICSGSTATRFK